MLCEYCASRPAAFQVKHPETRLHWRCLGCFRDFVRHNSGMPILVFGFSTPTRGISTNDAIRASRIADAVRVAAAPGGK